MPEGPVVCDTGPLIALSLIDRLEILPRLYLRVAAPRAVRRAGHVEEVRPLLEAMAARGYYLSRRVVERAMHEAGEAGSLGAPP